MNSTEHFSASLGTLVKVISTIVCVILFGVVVASFFLPPQVPPFARWLARAVPVMILLGTLPFLVRGYTLTEHELVVHRLGWSNRFARAQILSAEADPEVFRSAVRVCGSAGLFGFFGSFWSKPLGLFRAYCTNICGCIVVRLRDRVIVVSPDEPERFLVALHARR